ncbi:hypothetical protein BV20DRAFT_982456 [Pilatotrama ljubarskyi]|nr:hypothetical protein BV20DRAFT_982456 [Pilatotrama ljubarskyi]
MSSPNHKVPSEIFEQIFRSLRQVDQQACTLVCQRWKDEANWILWQNPIITSKEVLNMAMGLFQRSPQLRNYVKSIRIRGEYADRNHPRTCWVKDALIQLARILPHVHTLAFEHWGAYPICKALLDALGTLQHVTEFTLRHCLIENIEALESLVCRLPRLDVLRLENLDWPKDYYLPPTFWDREEPRPKPILHLSKLMLQPTPSMYPTLCGFFKKCCVKHLDLVNLPPHTWRYSAYVEFLGPQLETLTIRPHFGWSFDMEDAMEQMRGFDLSQNTRLRSLVFKITDLIDDAPAWMLPVLDSAKYLPLADITFEMTLDYAESLQTKTWEETLRRLTGNWGSTLRKVKFVHRPIRDELVYSMKGRRFLEDATGIFRKRFQALEQLGILEVENAPLLELQWC